MLPVKLDFNARQRSFPHVMGIVNLNEQSFAAQGRLRGLDQIVRHAEQMLRDGASFIDLGAEPTNPQSPDYAISVDQELSLLMPVVEKIARTVAIPISVDTSQPEVMRQVVAAGAVIINDVRALRNPGAIETVADLQVPVCLMHMLYPEKTLTPVPISGNVIEHINAFFRERVQTCLNAGILPENIILDPGFGVGRFGKSTPQNLTIVKHLRELQFKNYPLLIGVSRKTSIGDILANPPEERLYGSLALAQLAMQNGAAIIRVHDVKPTIDVLKMTAAVNAVNN